MATHLELPDDFQHLIEKREAERRTQDAADAAAETQELPSGEERRKSARRADDRSQEK